MEAKAKTLVFSFAKEKVTLEAIEMIVDRSIERSVAKLATKDELGIAVSKLATKEEISKLANLRQV